VLKMVQLPARFWKNLFFRGGRVCGHQVAKQKYPVLLVNNVIDVKFSLNTKQHIRS